MKMKHLLSMITIGLGLMVQQNLQAQVPVLYINELMASNATTIQDAQGGYADWFEIYNPGNTAVDVAGFYVTDDLSNLTKFHIHTGNAVTSIPAHGFRIFWADSDTADGNDHCGFALSAGGEQLGLVYSNGTTIIDSISFGSQATDISYGRQTDGSLPWVSFSGPAVTPGTTNHPGSAGIENNAAASHFKIYPVPATGSLFFTESADVFVYDVMGRNVLAANQVNQIDITSLEPGTYILYNRTLSVSLRFIKQ